MNENEKNISSDQISVVLQALVDFFVLKSFQVYPEAR